MFLSAGFYLMRPDAERSPSIPAELRFSLSDCLSEFLPDTWCIGWAADAQEDQYAHRARFSLDRCEYELLVARITSGFDQHFGWTNVIYDLDVAKDLHEAYGRSRGFDLVEVGMHETDVADFVACATPPQSPPGFAPNGETGILQKLKRNEAMSSSGVFLGFEPVSFHFCMGHSWRCALSPAQFGPTNDAGLIGDMDHARTIAMRLTAGTLPAEPERYFAWRMHRIEGPSA